MIAQLLRLFEEVLVAGLLVLLDALAHADLRVARLLQATTRRVLLAGEELDARVAVARSEEGSDTLVAFSTLGVLVANYESGCSDNSRALLFALSNDSGRLVLECRRFFSESRRLLLSTKFAGECSRHDEKSEENGA